MAELSASATDEKKIQFLLTVLEGEEKRRDALEQKSSVLLAANTLLLGSVTGFVLPLVIKSNPPFPLLHLLQLILFAVIFLFSIGSIMQSLEIMAPFTSLNKRQRIMDLGSHPSTEYNLFWFVKIAEISKDEYRQRVDSLSENEIYCQLSNEVHNLSRLLLVRYNMVARGHVFFMTGLGVFVLLVATILFVD